MDKIYLHDGSESAVNNYLTCRDGIVRRASYFSDAGYGVKTEIYLCENTKHESISIVRLTNIDGSLYEDVLNFYSDDFEFLKILILGEGELIRDYSSKDERLNFRL